MSRRDKLSLKVTSPTPAIANDNSSPTLPEPLHADPNLVVYAFPLSPAAPAPAPTSGEDSTSAVDTTMSTDGASSNALKRRRSSSSSSPPPRAKSPPGSPAFDSSSSSFVPSRLRGDDAARWRSLVLRDMFRGTAFEPAPPPPPPPSPSGRRVPTPAYLAQALPPLDLTGPVPDAMSYFVVGPRLRGRFLPDKARRLGVKPGKAFSRLIAGERVWVSAKAAEDAAAATVAAVVNKAEGRGGEKKKESKKERQERLKREKAADAAAGEAQEGVGEGRWVEAAECMEPGQDGTVRTLSRSTVCAGSDG